MKPLIFSIPLLWLVGACGSGKIDIVENSGSAGDTSQHGLKMRHQILFKNGDDSQVFEGYMILSGAAFVVKAFAGPGVDLFTIARHKDRHKETLHISALSDRLDVAKIGADIFRVYMEGCLISDDAKPSEAHCLLHGQRVSESYDAKQRLIERRFPDAHGIGLNVRYLNYRTIAGRLLPMRMELRWGERTDRLMIIHTASAEQIADFDIYLIDDFLN